MEQERCTAPPYIRLQPRQFCRYLCQLPLKATKCLTLWMPAQLSHVPSRELSRKAKWKHTNADHVSSTQKLYNHPPGSQDPHKKHWQHQPQPLSLTAQMKFFIGTIATVVITITLPRWLDTNMIFTFEHSSWAVCPIGKASGCWWGGDRVKLLEKDTFWKAIRLFLLYRKSSPNGKSSIIACSSWFNQMFCGFKLSEILMECFLRMDDQAQYSMTWVILWTAPHFFVIGKRNPSAVSALAFPIIHLYSLLKSRF